MTVREQAIRSVLASLGADNTYKGIDCMVDIVKIIMEDEDKLQDASVNIFPIIAKRHTVCNAAMQRNLRTIVDITWKMENRSALEKLAARKLLRKPTLMEFIDLLAAGLVKMGY